MKDLKGRPSISFGTRYIPTFYTPIVKSMQRKMISMGYSPVALNHPFVGGQILRWLSSKFPNVFIFSMEINKKLYMAKDRVRSVKYKLEKVSTDLTKIFDIEPLPEHIGVKWPEKKDKITKAGKIHLNLED